MALAWAFIAQPVPLFRVVFGCLTEQGRNWRGAPPTFARQSRIVRLVIGCRSWRLRSGGGIRIPHGMHRSDHAVNRVKIVGVVTEYPNPQEHVLPRGSTAAYIAGFIVAVAVILLVGFGWWAPNVQAWSNCGAPKSFSLMRGVFERPDLPTCIAIKYSDE